MPGKKAARDFQGPQFHLHDKDGGRALIFRFDEEEIQAQVEPPKSTRLPFLHLQQKVTMFSNTET